MKRRILFLLLFCIGLFSLVSFSSCSDDSEDVDDYNKQTVLVFMPWSGSSSSSGLYNYFLANIDSIESAIKTAKGNTGRVLVFISNSAESSDLYEITYEKGQVRHMPLKTYDGNIYTTADGIASILNDVKTYAPALNYAMIIGCHGSGWTYKEDWTNYPYGAKRLLLGNQKSNQTPTPPYPITRFYGSVSDNNYATNIPTLAEGIATARIKMQYILFDDCYMANVETAYELRNVTNFLIGSTSEVMGVGMPYQTMWSSLASATPSYTTAANDFYKFYSNYNYPYGGLSVVDCRKMDNLASCMKAINDHFTFDETQRDSLQALDGFNTHIFYDLGDYVAHLCQNTDLLNDFNSALSSAIKATVHTDQLYSYIYLSGPRLITVKHYSGLTISDPSVNSVAVKGKEKTAWWTATH